MNARSLTKRHAHIEVIKMLLTIAIILVALWAVGLIAHIAGGLIHIVLIIAIVMFAMHFLRGSSAP